MRPVVFKDVLSLERSFAPLRLSRSEHSAWIMQNYGVSLQSVNTRTCRLQLFHDLGANQPRIESLISKVRITTYP